MFKCVDSSQGRRDDRGRDRKARGDHPEPPPVQDPRLVPQQAEGLEDRKDHPDLFPGDRPEAARGPRAPEEDPVRPWPAFTCSCFSFCYLASSCLLGFPMNVFFILLFILSFSTLKEYIYIYYTNGLKGGKIWSTGKSPHVTARFVL